jgi:hypothetical protein
MQIGKTQSGDLFHRPHPGHFERNRKAGERASPTEPKANCGMSTLGPGTEIAHQVGHARKAPGCGARAAQLICPTGCLANLLSSPLCKNISLHRLVDTALLIPPSHPTRGAYRDRHGRGAGCGGRGCALDEWRLMRTAKSCGPDAPTLASSWRKRFRWRRWQTSPVTGESAKETVKTIARGMPDVSGVTVVTNACAFYHCTRGCGRAERPAFPAPSDWRGRDSTADLARNARRDRGRISRRRISRRHCLRNDGLTRLFEIRIRDKAITARQSPAASSPAACCGCAACARCRR